jgi:hypothetical protein
MVQSGFDDAIVQINEISNKLISAVDHLWWNYKISSILTWS